MLSKRPLPIIGRLSELLVSGNRAGSHDISVNPKNPLDIKKGLKRDDLDGGVVGLGIVAALEKTSRIRNGIFANIAISGHVSIRSDPIPCCEKKKIRGLVVDDKKKESLELEDYTYVTRHRGPNKSCTKVYYGDSRCDKAVDVGKESPPVVVRLKEDDYRVSSYLSSCHMCCKKLDGKDIYMYRGEKAYCSTECRSEQMMIDEQKKKSRSRNKRLSTSPPAGKRFSTGIFAI